MSMRGEIAIPAGPGRRHTSATQGAWDQFVAAITHPELVMIVAFCAIGLLITARFIHSFPNFGQMAEALDLRS